MKPEWWQFVLGAVLAWGSYVPVLHEGQHHLGAGKVGDGAMKAFLFVGIAYFLTAVLVPLALMAMDVAGARQGVWNQRGMTFATAGGIAGAAGALCIVLSLKYGGTPLYVAPLVFAGAPIVNVVISLVWKTRQVPGPLFFTGVLLAAVGAGLVLYSKADLDKKLRDKHAAAKQAPAVVAAAETPPLQPGESAP